MIMHCFEKSGAQRETLLAKDDIRYEVFASEDLIKHHRNKPTTLGVDLHEDRAGLCQQLTCYDQPIAKV
jgi:hypothetical protein